MSQPAAPQAVKASPSGHFGPRRPHCPAAKNANAALCPLRPRPPPIISRRRGLSRFSGMRREASARKWDCPALRHWPGPPLAILVGGVYNRGPRGIGIIQRHRFHVLEGWHSCRKVRFGNWLLRRDSDSFKGNGAICSSIIPCWEDVAMESLREGQTVEYVEGRGPKGPRAENVRVV